MSYHLVPSESSPKNTMSHLPALLSSVLSLPTLEPRQNFQKQTNYHFQTITSSSSSSSSTNKKKSKASSDDYHSTLKALNSKGRRQARKSLGQHYMVDSSINEKMADVANVGEGDLVLEIGPGTGSLTNVLIRAGATVIAVEKDPHMAILVKERFESTKKLMILPEDFVKCDILPHFNSLLEKRKHIGKDLNYAKVVANIPFNISTDVIKLLLPMGDIFSEVVLLLQDETALRFVDAPLRTSEYRPINIFVNFYSDPEYKFRVERSSFFPQPNVDAAVVRFKLKKNSDCPPVSSVKGFFSMVNSAFNGKRKMLRKTLQHLCSSQDIEFALKNANLPVTARPEELTLDDFVSLHNSISKATTSEEKE